MYSEKKKILCYCMLILLGVTTMFQGTAIVGAATLTNNGTTVVSNDTFDVSKNAKGQTVYTLKGDVTNGLELTLADGETAILDGGGYTVKGRDAIRTSDNDISSTPALAIQGSGTLVVRNAMLVGGDYSDGEFQMNKASSGVDVGDNCNLIFEETVSLAGGNGIALGGSSSSDGKDKIGITTGLNFDGNQLVMKSGSKVTVEASDIEPVEDRGVGIHFNGNLWEKEEGAEIEVKSCSLLEYSSNKNEFLSSNLKGLTYKYGRIWYNAAFYSVTIKNLCNQKEIDSREYMVPYYDNPQIVNKDMLPVLSSEEYELIGYYTDEQLNTPLENGAQVTDNMVIYAKYERLIKDITFNSNGGSSVAKQEVKVGEKLTKPTDPTMAGYTFKGWYTDKELTKVFSFDTVVNEDMTLYAKWEKNLEPTTAVQKPTKVAMSQAKIEKIKAVTYSGYAKKPSVKVTDQGKTLKKGTDYTVSYKNNKKVGTAKVTVTGKGNYTGTKTATFKIKKRKNGVYAKGIYQVSGDGVNGHKKAGKKYKVIATYKAKTKLEVTKVIKKKTSKKTYIWLKVKYKGKSSYVYSKYVK